MHTGRPHHTALILLLLAASCQPSRPAPVALPVSGAAQFIWGSYYDTDIEVGGFFGIDHSVMVRFLPQYELTYEAPLVSNGSFPAVSVYAAGTEVICLEPPPTGSCDYDKLAAGLFLQVGTTRATYAIQHPVPYMEGLESGGQAPVPSPPVWRHLFLVRRGPLVEVWLDGDHLCRQRETLCDLPISGPAPAGRLRLGSRATGSNQKIAQFYGFIDDVAVFDHALTQAELEGWFLTGSGIAEGTTGLRTGLNFDQSSQNGSLHIRSPGTLSGPATIVPVGAQHASAVDAAHLPIVAGTGPIELPFMGQQIWEVIQQFAVRGSHAGDAAFSWDFVHVPDDHPRGSPRGYGVESDAIKFIAGAEGTVVRVVDTHPDSAQDKESNTIDIERGPGEILQYLHLKQGSATVTVNDAVSRGDVLGIVSNVGGGTPHLHFAVLSRIDWAYVTRPAYFVSYCVSRDFGLNWQYEALGMPTNGQWVKRAQESQPYC